jgi:hypothetical protein
MRRTIIMLALSCLITLAACTAPAPAPTATSLPSATPLPSPTNTPLPTATITATTAPTASATPRPTKTSLPPTATFDLRDLLPTGQPVHSWNNITVMPGAISGAEDSKGYRYTIKESPEKIQEYYNQELKKQGYSTFAVGAQGGEDKMLMYTKGNKSLVIWVVVVDELTLVMISPA